MTLASMQKDFLVLDILFNLLQASLEDCASASVVVPVQQWVQKLSAKDGEYVPME